MQCTECGRHVFEVFKDTDKKTKKVWLIRRCTVCLKPNAIMPDKPYRVTPADFDD